MDELLRLLEGHQATATFFVRGCIAERRPEVVHAIAAAGHQVVSHGWRYLSMKVRHTRVRV
ncbi:MAG: polysaccharide deacetylase family protein [Gemmatimonadetes bacterium]|nr:polysaccharide deacetylase family protein [Gemmatimonadota bacterium]